MSGVTTHCGSAMGLAGSGTMAGFPADATTMKVGTGIAEVAVGISGPVETELFPNGCEHGVLALGIWGKHSLMTE